MGFFVKARFIGYEYPISRERLCQLGLGLGLGLRFKIIRFLESKDSKIDFRRVGYCSE